MSNELLELPSDELKQKMWDEFGLNKDRIQESVQKLKDWLQQQPHLPDDDVDTRLERFLLNCKNSMENTKSTLDLYYTLKALTPDYMTGWDTNQDWFHKLYSISYIYPVRQLTSEGDRVTIVGLLNSDATHFDLINLAKISFMLMEMRTCDDYWRSNILVIDLKNYSMGHVPKFTLPLIRKFEIILMKGYKYRLKSAHLLNVPPFAEFVINMVKSVLKPKIAARIQTHGSDLAELYKQVPKHLLPSDFGGDGEEIVKHNEMWKRKLEENKEWILERENMKSDEKRRPGKVLETGDIFGFEGSFRKLDLD
ncbi:hypothetical protein L9F63_022587 [Diploptera punctata]|uniref:CRAL-TRIO domain-containing protein n=1 Tax=Diploptera punctata TaxID=6984 RepID=A0AAD7ZME7_DIPPU|nr:hypothetical protein L9F63_022587 [Diploptera punctata]